MDHLTISNEEVTTLLERSEDHYIDFKSKGIRPASLEKQVSAFANSSGGEFYVGIEEVSPGIFEWSGFSRIEDMNGHVHVLMNAFPASDTFQYDTLFNPNSSGYVLRVTIGKTRYICKTSAGDIYIRGAASVKRLSSPCEIEELKLAKGVTSYETSTTQASLAMVTDSLQITEFVIDALTFSEPEPWLRSQMMIVSERPTVAAVVLFADEPQAVLPKASVMVYRYASTDEIGMRDHLVDGKTWNIEGSAIKQIDSAVKKVTELIETVKSASLEDISYPPETLHEILANAVIHRDYSIQDNIHVRIFDDRVEVESPGRLPGNVTPRNLPGARFSRNTMIERMLHKFSDAPNKNVGEGLMTAFQAMTDMRLAEPEINETENGVLVTIRHSPLDSPATIILRYLDKAEDITNRKARELTNIQSDSKMRRILANMIKQGVLEQVPGTIKGGYKYRKVLNP